MRKKTLTDAVLKDMEAAGKEMSEGKLLVSDFLIKRAIVLALLDVASALREPKP